MKYCGVAASGCAPDRSMAQLKSKVTLLILVIFLSHFFILLLGFPICLFHTSPLVLISFITKQAHKEI